MAETMIRKYSTEERLGRMELDVITVTPTCDASGTDDNDVLFDFVEIPYAASIDGGACLLHSIQLLDADDVGAKLDLVFATASTALGTIDAAVSITDANAQEILGYVQLEDYFDGINWKMSTKSSVGLALKCAEGTRSLYVAGVNRNGASITQTASGIQLKLGLLKD